MSRELSTYEVPNNPAMRRAWILYQLRCRGLSGRAIAKREGVSNQAVSAAMIGGGNSHLQEAIAAAIGLNSQQLFPELYDAASGKRLGVTRPPNRITRASTANVQNEEAA